MTGIRTFSMAMAVLSGLGVLGTVEGAQGDTLTVGAAHSLKPVFHEIIPIFEKEYGVAVQVVYGPSKSLRRQIEGGAAIDVFLPEAVGEVETLQRKGLTLNGGFRTYAQTSIVLVMSATSAATPVSVREVLPNRATRIALADPKTSALGDITARALAQLDPAYRDHPQLLHAEHTDAIVNLVRTGKADVGIVYRVDAINSGHLRIIDEVPVGTYTPVQFGQAVVWTCRDASLRAAEAFFNYMMSPRIQKLLLKYGFDFVTPSGHTLQ